MVQTRSALSHSAPVSSLCQGALARPFAQPSVNDFSVTVFMLAFSDATSIVFPNLALVAGDFSLTQCSAVTASFPVLSVIGGSVFVGYNPALTSLDLGKLTVLGGTISFVARAPGLMVSLPTALEYFGSVCAGCTTSSCSAYTDIQTCSRITGDRRIDSTSAKHLSSFLLQSTAGYLEIYSNSALTRIEFPSLSSMGGSLQIRENAMLTFAHLPKLTYIGERIKFCSNHASFAIPVGPLNAPTGGLVVTGPIKGTSNCVLSQGALGCGASNCP